MLNLELFLLKLIFFFHLWKSVNSLQIIGERKELYKWDIMYIGTYYMTNQNGENTIFAFVWDLRKNLKSER